MADSELKFKEAAQELRRKAEHYLALARQLEALSPKPSIQSLSDGLPVGATLIPRQGMQKRAADWVEEYLRESPNQSKHYYEIAREIIARGYQGTLRSDEKIGSEKHIQRTARSLSGILNREKERFEGFGQGYFGLRNVQDS